MNFLDDVKSLSRNHRRYLVWPDGARYENELKFNTASRDTDVYVPENVIFTGREPMAPSEICRQLLANLPTAQRRSGFGCRKDEIRFHPFAARCHVTR